MYLLCAKSPQGPPIAPGQSPLFRTKIDVLPPDSKITTLRNDVAKLLQMESNSFNLLYCGRILDDEKTMESYKIKSTSSIHVIPKAPKHEFEDVEEKKTATDEEFQQFKMAFAMALKNPAFNRVAQGLSKRENLESLIAANPSLAKDPIACGFLSKPELLLSLLDPETYKYVCERHPGLAEAASQLAATVHEERPSASSGNDTDASGSANPFGYHLDDMSDDDDEDEDMDIGQAIGGQRNNTAITPALLAEALSNARNTIFGGITGMGIMGGGDGAQPSSSNPGTSRSGQSSGWRIPTNTGENAGTSIPNTPSPGITQDQLARALAAASSSMTSPASSNSHQGFGGNLFFSPPPQASTLGGQGSSFGTLSQQNSEQQSNTNTDSQIATIREITGIGDNDLAAKALQLMGGDVQAAIDLILSGWLGEDDAAN
jgi:hypothetical protein